MLVRARQASFVKDGRIADAGRNTLQRTFDRYNFDVDQMRITFKHNLGQAGITLGNRVLFDDSFQYLSPYLGGPDEQAERYSSWVLFGAGRHEI
jgi:hypothetical protein